MTGVNLVTEVEQPLRWFLAPVVILVLLVIASSLDSVGGVNMPSFQTKALVVTLISGDNFHHAIL